MTVTPMPLATAAAHLCESARALLTHAAPALLAQAAENGAAARAASVRVGPVTLTNTHLLGIAARVGAIALTLVVAVVLLRLVPLLERLVLRWAGKHETSRGATDSMIDRRQRAETLTRVVSSVARVVIWGVTLIELLGRAGIDIGPLIAGAGIAGAAVAFGSQSIVKDFFSGFFILLENQFDVGDTVTIGSVTGTVERMTMRITVLRDASGTAHFIPNSSITTVANKTDGWGRVVLDVVFSARVPEADARAVMEAAAARATAAAQAEGVMNEPITVDGPAELAASGVTWRLVGKAMGYRAPEARSVVISALTEELRSRKYAPEAGAWAVPQAAR